VNGRHRFHYEQLRRKGEHLQRANDQLMTQNVDLAQELAEYTQRDAEHRQSIEAEQRLLAERELALAERELDAQRILDAEAGRQDRLANELHRLEIQHQHPELAIRETEDFIARYAESNREHLLTARKQITREYEAFHQDEVIEHFRLRFPALYLRTLPVFRWRALHAAERLHAENPRPIRPVQTPEQVRARMLRKVDMKATDRVELAKLIHAKAEEYRAELEALGTLEEEDIDEKVATFIEELTNDSDPAAPAA
jgi:hypothetical protein